MRVDAISQQRRVQGAFARTLRGAQPPQDHDRARRFGTPPRPLTVRNAAQLFTTAVMVGALLRPAGSRGAAPPPAAPEPALRPAFLPGAAATPSGGGYTGVAMTDTMAEAANAAAVGCVVRPASCPRLIAAALLSGTAGTFLGALGGWEAARRHAGCASNTPTVEPPRPAGLRPAPARPAAGAYISPRDAAPAPLGFRASDLDPSRDPCQSLYAHVNGRWANATRLDGPFARWHAVDVLRAQSLAEQRHLAEQLSVEEHLSPAQRVVADLWTSGMDTFHINGQHLAPLRDELDRIARLDSPHAIADHLRHLTRQGRNPVFGLAVEPDMDQRSTLIAYAHQGGLGLPDPSDYHDARRNDLRQAYLAHIVRLLELSGVSRQQASLDAQAVFALEQRLAAASMDRSALESDARLYYNPVNITQADTWCPTIRWTALFHSLGVDPPARFSLAMPNFHRTVDTALCDTDPAVWRAYLRFHSLDLASPYLGDAFADAAHAFRQQLIPLNQPLPPRWLRVLAAIDAYAGPAMSEVYSNARFSADSKARVERMAEQIRTALKQRLGTLPWMDEATRVTAQAKAEQLDPRIGHPVPWQDWSGLRTERCGFLDNLHRARAYQQQARFALIGQPADRRPPRFSAHAVDAHFDVMNNDMSFSAALLQPPYFDPAADDALNYGAAGACIGHEMTHAFTAETAQFAPDGSLRLWWTRQDLNRYDHLFRQLAGQFDQQRVDGLPINGTLTGTENLADLGGLALALEALRMQTASQTDPMLDGLSREQRFFISWAVINRRLQTRDRLRLELMADTHSLGAPRTNVAPSNLPAFAEAFNCSEGTPMARSRHNRVEFL